MILYLDTSLLVSVLSPETETPRTQAWLAGQPADRRISIWVVTEFSSAIAMKVRTGEIDLDTRASILTRFHGWIGSDLTILPIEQADFRVAARFSDRHELGVRAADALHLAVCTAHGTTLCTLDRRLAQAGPPLGVPTVLV